MSISSGLKANYYYIATKEKQGSKSNNLITSLVNLLSCFYLSVTIFC